MIDRERLYRIKDEPNERRRLELARELIAESAAPGSARGDVDHPMHAEHTQIALACQEIICELGPRYDIPPKKNLGFVEFVPDPAYDEIRKAKRLGLGGHYKPK